LRKLSQSREGQRSGEEKSDGSQNGEARNKWNYLTRNSKKKVLSKDGKHSDEKKSAAPPSTVLTPPVTGRRTAWPGLEDSKTVYEMTSQKSPRSTSDFVEETTDKIVNIPSVADEIHEIRQISYKAKATLNRIREFANKTKTTRKCQAASDCGSDQVCYLPTNQCKDQLTFSTDLAPQFRVGERSECALTEDCQDNEVCYQPSQRCVCALGFIEVSGECRALQDFTCADTRNVSQMLDSSMWGVQPYCSAWGNNTLHGDKTGMLSYGEYQSGTGALTDPMLFLGGSDASCSKQRSCQLVYECYCEEFDCSVQSPEFNTTSLWWGEFNPCEYSAYVYTPLACSHLIL